MRCVPHDEDTGGFFVATLRKIPRPEAVSYSISLLLVLPFLVSSCSLGLFFSTSSLLLFYFFSSSLLLPFFSSPTSSLLLLFLSTPSLHLISCLDPYSAIA